MRAMALFDRFAPARTVAWLFSLGPWLVNMALTAALAWAFVFGVDSLLTTEGGSGLFDGRLPSDLLVPTRTKLGVLLLALVVFRVMEARGAGPRWWRWPSPLAALSGLFAPSASMAAVGTGQVGAPIAGGLAADARRWNIGLKLAGALLLLAMSPWLLAQVIALTMLARWAGRQQAARRQRAWQNLAGQVATRLGQSLADEAGAGTGAAPPAGVAPVPLVAPAVNLRQKITGILLAPFRLAWGLLGGPMLLAFWATEAVVGVTRLLWPVLRCALGLLWRTALIWAVIVAASAALLPAATIPASPAATVNAAPQAPLTGHAAAEANDAAAFQRAVRAGEAIEGRDWQGRSLLLAALDALIVQQQTLRLVGGMDPDTSRRQQQAVAAWQQSVDELLAKGADPALRDYAGRSGYLLALMAGHQPTGLVPSSPVEPTHLGMTLFHAAAWFGDVALAERIAATDGRAAARTTDGRTAMHFAGSPSMVAYLVRLGLSVNDRDSRGRSPFHHAVLRGDAATAWVLGGAVQDRTARDIFGNRALDYAPPDMRTKKDKEGKKGGKAPVRWVWEEMREVMVGNTGMLVEAKR